ncbi:MAG TPA: adenine phosphoribosyltransferase [Candidatus Obscuribacterales bacterium]
MSVTNKASQEAKSKDGAVLPLSAEKIEWLKSNIRDIPDFPKPGIIFKDLTTLLQNGQAFSYVIDVMAEHCKSFEPNMIAGIEARGFILAPAIAYRLGVGFVPIRKPKKLPYRVERVSYDLEYGSDAVEVHVDAVAHGHRVVLIDDLLATGGTAGAAYQLLTKIGAHVVSIGFVSELSFLNGRTKLPKEIDVFSLISY